MPPTLLVFPGSSFMTIRRQPFSVKVKCPGCNVERTFAYTATGEPAERIDTFEHEGESCPTAAQIAELMAVKLQRSR